MKLTVIFAVNQQIQKTTHFDVYDLMRLNKTMTMNPPLKIFIKV